MTSRRRGGTDPNGSFLYDSRAMTLINYLIMGLEDIQHRMEERRLLNALKFDRSLSKLEQLAMKKQSLPSELRNRFIYQIESYRKCYEVDKQMAYDDAYDFEIDNPQELLHRVHDQALHDGYISELV